MCSNTKEKIYKEGDRVKAGKEYRQEMMEKMNFESGDVESFYRESAENTEDCMDRVETAREENQARIDAR